jgi:hypothetical protein
MAITDPPRIRRNQKPWLPATLALLLILLVTSCAFPEEGSDGSLDGTYYMNGVDRDGVEYSGTLVIAATGDPDVYDMQWIITGSIQTGTGTVDGNSVIIEWAAMEGFDAASHGSGHYNISADGELTGERTVANQEGVATEEAFPIK